MTDLITSAANPAVKALRALERKKGREEQDAFLAEGERLATQGVERGWTLQTLVLSHDGTAAEAEAAAQGGGGGGRHAALEAAARAQGARVLRVVPHLMRRIARKDNPQTVLASFKRRKLALGDLELAERQGEALVIVLHTVRDPGNLGTILRTADCAGADAVVLAENCCDPYSVEAVRASMGSVFDMPLVQCGWDTLADWAEERGLALAAATLDASALHTEADLSGPLALVMGNEQRGLPDAAAARCALSLRLPMAGGADSLNLAQATAVLAYEVWRQRGFAGADPRPGGGA